MSGGRRRDGRRSAGGGRLVLLFVLLVVAFCGMAGRLVTLQIVQAPAYATLAADQRSRVVEFPARRGAIFDRNGNALAVSVDLDTVYADPGLVARPGRVARKLAPLLGEPVRVVLDAVTADSRFEYLARQVPPELAADIEALGLPGIYLEGEPKRFYPGGRLASQVLGFTNIDGVGMSGVELQYEDILRGRPGRMSLEQDPEGRALPQTESRYSEPEPGRSLFLTLDKEIQYYSERALARAVEGYGAAAGSAIVMTPDDGQIIAMANWPDFNPNSAGDFPPEAHRNRAVTDFYEPGSAFKAVTAAAAIDDGAVTPRTTFDVPDTFPYSDRVFHDSHPHATERMSVARIIEESSNVGTIKIGLELGGAKLDRYVRSFGFGSMSGLDFPAETAGAVLDRGDWSGSTVATVPIGQGIAVSPLQLASAYAALANGGVWIEPKLLFGTANDRGGVDGSPPPGRRRVVSRRTASKMAGILTRVTERGTGVAARIPGYSIAGKTGTAQKPVDGGYGGEYVASFAGYAPAADPEVVVLVVLDDPEPIWGGLTAAPTFADIAEFALRRLGVPPTRGAGGPALVVEDSDVDDPAFHD